MLEFIKMFGLGILYTILSPLLLVVFLLFVAYSFVNYLVCESIYLGGFFLGKRFSEKTKLDKKYEKIKKERESLAQHHIVESDVDTSVQVSENEGGDYHA